MYVVTIVCHSDQLIRPQEEIEELSPNFLKEPCPAGRASDGSRNSHNTALSEGAYTI
jgi:hypothetical protein